MIPIMFLDLFVNSALVGSGIAILIGLVLFFWGLKSLRESQVVAQIPESPVGSVAPGPVHVHGKTSGDGALTSPITGMPCYYYKAQVEKWVKQGDQERWQVFKNETAQRNFCIEDGTGRVLVDPQGAEFSLPQTIQAEIGPKSNHSCFLDPSLGLPRPNENQLHAILISDWQQARAAVQSLGIPGAKVADKVLGAGETMARWGVTMNVDGVEINPGGVGESFRFHETCLLAGREYSVIGTCDQSNGKVIRKGTSNKTFIISPKSGQQLAKSLHLQGFLMVAIGALMTIAALAFATMNAFKR